MMVFLALVASHFIADFILQSGFKEERHGAHLVRHLVVFAGVFALSLWALDTWTQTGLSVMVIAVSSGFSAVLHVLQDVAITRWRKRSRWKISDLVLFVGDQGLHLVVLLAVAFVINQQISAFSVFLAAGRGFGVSQVVFGSALLFALGTGFSAVLLAHCLAPFKKAVDAEAEGVTVPSAGLWIGICERFLLIMIIAAGTEVFSSVGLVMGVKSIFRFRELDKRASAEYYLLGSLVSICIAVAIGLVLRWLIYGSDKYNA